MTALRERSDWTTSNGDPWMDTRAPGPIAHLRRVHEHFARYILRIGMAPNPART
jgi:hypothetical protein